MSKKKLDKYEDDNEQEPLSDIYFYFPLSDFLNPIFHKLGFKPNHITLLSTISTLYAVYCFKQGKKECYFYYFLGYLFDSMDGRMARKYNQGSIFGMIFDLVSDNITNLPLILVFLCKIIESLNKPNCGSYKKILIFVFIVLFGFILTVQYGINEAIDSYTKHKDDNFYKYKVELMKKHKYDNTFLGKLFLLITKQSYNSYRMTYPNPLNEKTIKLIKERQLSIKEFGPGNYNIFILIAMYIFNN